jgi:hypothetical protein
VITPTTPTFKLWLDPSLGLPLPARAADFETEQFQRGEKERMFETFAKFGVGCRPFAVLVGFPEFLCE